MAVQSWISGGRMVAHRFVRVLLGALLALMAPFVQGQEHEPKASQDEKQSPAVEQEGLVLKEADVAALPPAESFNEGDQAPAQLPALVTEVSGTVEWAPSGASVLAKEGWLAVKLGDKLEPGSQLRTGLRSHVNLQFGETTLISVRSATHASIDQFFESAKMEHVRMGLGYGTVRGGSTEGEIRADVLIDSTVATLAKRGTEGWQMTVEPVTGRFNVSLAQFGLVEAIRKTRDANRLTKSVRPGEYVNNVNIGNLWIKQDIFNRNVTFFQADSVSMSDADFNTDNTRGYAVMAPGGGADLSVVSNRTSATFVLDQLASRNPRVAPPNLAILDPGPIGKPEGNFGTGPIFRTRVPVFQRK